MGKLTILVDDWTLGDEKVWAYVEIVATFRDCMQA
jgi:hypothetical protein